MKANSRPAIRLVILLGVVSLFADVTYEGARSITGPFLALLGANAVIVGFVSGFGELIGYCIRLISGYFADRTGRYWGIAIFGYAVNLIAVPLLALAGSWQMAAFLIVAERLGKGVRTPVRDVMLSHAASEMGRGWGFALHEAMDQVGAMLGPLIVAGILYFQGTYRAGFAILLVPAIFAICLLTVAALLYPRPRGLESSAPQNRTEGLSKTYWIYLAAMTMIAAGYADFPLIAFHFQKSETVPGEWIPVFYAVAMGVDAIAALIFGRFFDRKGFAVLIGPVVVSLFFAPLVMFGGFWMSLAGMILWGTGMGAQESVMRAAVAGMVPPDKRGTAYGLFNTGYGVFWFLGSVLMGYLYDRSLLWMVGFSMLSQSASVPFLLLVRKKTESGPGIRRSR
ncbi:MAG: MFS transporter [Acidobacteria bacterium]|nr:MFS transporter [Acidobacteriota bacterium]